MRSGLRHLLQTFSRFPSLLFHVFGPVPQNSSWIHPLFGAYGGAITKLESQGRRCAPNSAKIIQKPNAIEWGIMRLLSSIFPKVPVHISLDIGASFPCYIMPLRFQQLHIQGHTLCYTLPYHMLLVVFKAKIWPYSFATKCPFDFDKPVSNSSCLATKCQRIFWRANTINMLPLELDSQAEKNRKEKSKDTEKQRKNADRAEIREAKPQKKKETIRINSHCTPAAK